MSTRSASALPALESTVTDEQLRHLLAGAMSSQPPNLSALRTAVRAHVAAARDEGQMIERIIATIKARVRQLTPARAENNHVARLLQHLVTWSIDEYYRGR